jgi:hypothetical protein
MKSKLTRTNPVKTFQPFKLEINVENEKEALALFSVLNYTACSDTLAVMGMKNSELDALRTLIYRELVSDYGSAFDTFKVELRKAINKLGIPV